MIFDRQQSSFGIRLFLISYFLYLLINLILFTNDFSMKDHIHSIVICVLALIIFLIILHGLWFENLIILYLIIILLISLCFHIFFMFGLVMMKKYSLENSPYLFWNCFWLKKMSNRLSSIVCLLINLMMNISSLVGIFHLFSSICPNETI